MVHEKTKAILLNRVYIIDKDVKWNESYLEKLKAEIAAYEKVVLELKNERASLIEDLGEAGVEVDVPVQD